MGRLRAAGGVVLYSTLPPNCEYSRGICSKMVVSTSTGDGRYRDAEAGNISVNKKKPTYTLGWVSGQG